MALGFRAGGAQHTITKHKTDPNAINAEPLTSALFGYAGLKQRQSRIDRYDAQDARSSAYYTGEYAKTVDDPDRVEAFSLLDGTTQRLELRSEKLREKNRLIGEELYMYREEILGYGVQGEAAVQEIEGRFTPEMLSSPEFDAGHVRDWYGEAAEELGDQVRVNTGAMRFAGKHMAMIEADPNSSLEGLRFLNEITRRAEGWTNDPKFPATSESQFNVLMGNYLKNSEGTDIAEATDQALIDETMGDVFETIGGPDPHWDMLMNPLRREAGDFSGEAPAPAEVGVDPSQAAGESQDSVMTGKGRYVRDPKTGRMAPEESTPEGDLPKKFGPGKLSKAMESVRKMAGKLRGSKMGEAEKTQKLIDEASKLLGKPITEQELEAMFNYTYEGPLDGFVEGVAAGIT